MNKVIIVNIEGPFESTALRILREIPGVTVTARQRKRSDRGVDAILRFDGTHAHVAIEVKHRANAAFTLLSFVNPEKSQFARRLPLH